MGAALFLEHIYFGVPISASQYSIYHSSSAMVTMYLSSIRAKTISTPFLDHTNQPALSITYPVLKDLQKKYALQRQQQPGSLETHLNYPCFQVYVPRPHAPGKDLSHEQTKVEGIILELIADLERHRFFQAFKGIRLEVCYGRAEFAKYISSRGISKRVVERICNHALRERDERNTFECFKAAVVKFLNSNLRRQYAQNKKHGASTAELREMSNELNHWVQNICDLGALISPDISRLNMERKSYLDVLSAAQSQDPKSDADRSLIQNSEHGQDTIQKQYQSVTKTIEGLLRLELKKVRIPITPTSFYCPAPDEQPWHHLVIVLHSERMLEDGIHIIKFARDRPVVTELELETSLFMTGDLDYRVVSASFGGGARIHQSTLHVGGILACHLNALGLTNPSFLEGSTNSRSDARTDVGTGAGFKEMKREMEASKRYLHSIPEYDENGDVKMNGSDTTTGSHEFDNEGDEGCTKVEDTKFTWM